MKRASNCFEKITDLRNFHKAFYKASRRKRLSTEYLYFRQRLSENLAKLRFEFTIIDSYNLKAEGEILSGLPIGNLTSQFFANEYLCSLDHFVLEKLKPKGFVRYMDDMVLFADDIALLKNAFEQLSYYTEETLKCRLKPPIFGRTRDGVPFLGWLITDKRIFLLRKSKKRSAKTIRRINNLACAGFCENRINGDTANY